mgnify:FL=1
MEGGANVVIEAVRSGEVDVAIAGGSEALIVPGVVTAWQAGLRTKVSEAAWAPAGFRQPGSLYYYHPGGRTLILCNEPYHELAVRRESLLSITPTPVKLTPR